jgi:hypothetical protein
MNRRIGSNGIDKDIECDGIMSSLLEDRAHTHIWLVRYRFYLNRNLGVKI